MNVVDVARQAGVSTATVSRVLNNAGAVKTATRARVMKVVEELKFRPNLHARSLARGRSRSIGVIVSNIENPFFFEIYKAVEKGARAEGYEIILANTGYSSEQLMASVWLMIGQRVAGLAAITSEMHPELIEELAGYQMPVVFYDVGAQRRNITNIRVNYRRGMEKLMGYLIRLGHRRLGIVGHHAMLGPIRDRVAAALESMSRYGEVVVKTAADADGLEGGRRATRVLLSANPGLTAIACVNDFMAVGAIREIRDRGLKVPRDISVTGFDNLELGKFCYPALTSVHIPRDRIGEMICDVLLQKDRTRAEHKIVIDPELVVRDSTGPAPNDLRRPTRNERL